MAATTMVSPSFRTAAPFNSNWFHTVDPKNNAAYWVLSSIESQSALSNWLTHNDTRPSRHDSCLNTVFSTAVFKTVIDLRAFARNMPHARTGVFFECPTNGAKIQNMCVEIFVDREASQSFDAVVEIEQVIARCPPLQCLTIEVYSDDLRDGDAVRRQLIKVKNNRGSLLYEMAKSSMRTFGSVRMVSIEPTKYLAEC